MYTDYFGLKCNPFGLTPDPEFFFLSKEHKKALTYLNYGLSANTGFILLTGEIGTGKTTLIRKILKALNKNIKVARVNNTLVNSEQLISMINDDFGIDTTGKDKTRMLSDLSEFIVNQYAQGFRTALIIDEAQNLSSTLLEEIRLLSNLETDKSKLLQIILVGQPELKQILALPELRQLRQRISIKCHINPLTADETNDYIMHRLEVSGKRNAVTFGEGSIELLHAFSRGIPRLINMACDFIMLNAFSSGTTKIDKASTKEVIDELEADGGFWKDEKAPVPEKGRRRNQQDPMREVLARLKALESHGEMNSRNFKEKEVFEMLLDREGVIEEVLERLKRERSSAGDRAISDIAKELYAVRSRLEKLERAALLPSATDMAGNHSRKNIWNRLFG